MEITLAIGITLYSSFHSAVSHALWDFYGVYYNSCSLKMAVAFV